MSRKRQLDERRRRISGAARDMVRQTGSADFTVVDLAAKVKLNPATIYNLFGSKGKILYSILYEHLDNLAVSSRRIGRTGSAIMHPVATMMHLSEVLVSDSMLFKPLHRQLDQKDTDNRPAFMETALKFWSHSLDKLVRSGYLSSEHAGTAFTQDRISRALISKSIGLINLWSHGHINDNEFRAIMAHDAALIMYPISHRDDRGILEDVISQNRSYLPTRLNFIIN